jgi:hypothetical protein
MVSDNTQGDLEVARALRFTGAAGVVPAPLGNVIWVDGSGNLRLDNFTAVEVASIIQPSPAVSAPTLSSGVALKDATGVQTTWYIPITGHASGTVVVAIGPTSTPANNLWGTLDVDATTIAGLTVVLPANWYIEVTVGGSATIGTPTVVTSG